jgi:predicted metalloendopeptidase
MYLNKHFDNGTINEINDIINALKDSFIEVLTENIEKYNETISSLSENFLEMNSEIGYPTSVDLSTIVEQCYKGLEIDSKNFFKSIMNVKRRKNLERFSILGKPIADTIWFFELKPFDVEAWYIMLLNRIIIPAGILQQPFYLKEYDAYNFAAIGMMIGHEVGHAFERFIETDEDVKDCLVNQYNSYTFKEIGRPVDGEKTYSKLFCQNKSISLSIKKF